LGSLDTHGTYITKWNIFQLTEILFCSCYQSLVNCNLYEIRMLVIINYHYLLFSNHWAQTEATQVKQMYFILFLCPIMDPYPGHWDKISYTYDMFAMPWLCFIQFKTYFI
jgi:hypothetical protein